MERDVSSCMSGLWATLPFEYMRTKQANSGFRHGKNDYVANFSLSEREVLINLVQQIIELLSERTDNHNEDPLAAMVGITSHDSPPDDEVLLRLLPNAYADQVDAAEFRRYTESTLRAKKSMHASRSQSLMDSSDGCIDVKNSMVAMNDIRLALGVIESSSNSYEELLAPDDPMRGVYAVYSWLGWLQESLVQVLMDDAL
jgi:hypothetical protein